MKRTLLAASISMVVLASIPGIAVAHPAYKDSSPQANTSVSSPPAEVWVEFTERIEGGSVTVYDACGERVDHGTDEMNLTSDRLTTGIHGDKAGTYVVQWSVLGADGHQTKGEFTFASSGGSECPSNEPEPEPEPEREREGNRERRTTTPSRPGNDTTDDRNDDVSGSTRRRDQGSDRATSRTNDQRRAGAGRQATNNLAQAPDQTTEPAGDKSIWDGIPLGDFLVALGVAALIGAAGGRIYAGIVGPRV